MSDMVRVLVFPNSLSSWRLLIALDEVGCQYSVESVDLFHWEHLEPQHLRLSPLGSVPVMVTMQGEPMVGEKMLQAVQGMGSGRSLVRLFPEGEEGKKTAMARIENHRRKYSC